ncbi:MAG: lysoplasmalogenase [Caldilineaceae bacterium]
MTILLLTILALLTALIHLWTEFHGPRWLIYFAKPATTILILIVAFVASTPTTRAYQAAIVIGLLFAVVGDIMLMLPTDRFVAGLVSFLVTHLCYIIAFATQTRWPVWSPWALFVPLYAGVIYALLHRHLGALRVPVMVYMAAIVVMAWQGVTLADQQRMLWAHAAGVGSILFVISDSVLALNRFRHPVAGAQLIVLSTYYVAQWLIAWSVYGTLSYLA